MPLSRSSAALAISPRLRLASSVFIGTGAGRLGEREGLELRAALRDSFLQDGAFPDQELALLAKKLRASQTAVPQQRPDTLLILFLLLYAAGGDEFQRLYLEVVP